MVNLIILKYMAQSYWKCRSWNWIVEIFYKSLLKQEMSFRNHVLVRHGTTWTCQSYLWAFSKLFYWYLFSMIFNNELITFFEANQNLILSSCLGTSIQFNTVYQKKKNINRYINFAPAELSLGFQRKTRKKRLLQNWFFLRIQYNSPKKVAILEHPFYPGRRNIEALTREQNHSENMIQSVDIMMFLLCY